MARGINETDRSTWEQRGGRIRFDAKGRPVYVIRKQIAGRRFEVSTHRHTLAAALGEWEKFEKDPEGYAADGGAGQAPLYLENKLVERFLAWSAGERGNSAGWLVKQKAFLADWMEELGAVNLRRLSLRDHVVPALEGATSRRHRLAVLKALYSWLRKHEHVLTSAEDPTIDMPLPQIEPAQWKRSKVIPRDHIDLVLEYLRAQEQERRAKREAREAARRPKGEAKVVQLVPATESETPDGPWCEALTIQAGTGWHTTEIVRFAATGSIEPLPRTVQQEGVAGVLVCPQHKSGEPMRTRVSAAVVEAAKRFLAHGAISREWYDRAVREACKSVKRPDGKVGIPVFTPGRLRHSVATWAIEAGADPASVAAFLGHKSPRTTRRFYATHASPAKVPTLA
jgi:integrase